MTAKQNRLWAAVERKRKLMTGASGEVQEGVSGGLALEEHSSEVENVLHETSGEMRKLMVERRKAEAEAEELRSLTRPRLFWAGGLCQGTKALKVRT